MAQKKTAAKADAKAPANSKASAKAQPSPKTPPAEKTPPAPKSKTATKLPLKVVQGKEKDGKVPLSVTVPASLIGQAHKGAALSLAAQHHLDLREVAGKDDDAAIEKVIELVGEPQFKAFLNHYTMNALAPHAVTQQNLDIVMDPEVSSPEQVVLGTDFQFTALATIKPSYELESYEPVVVTIPSLEVTDEEIDQQLYHFAESHATQVEDKGAEIKPGSEVAFAIESSDKEGAIENLTAKRRVYRLGEGFLPFDFDESLVGMKAGDTKTFEFNLPDFDPDAKPGDEPALIPITSTVTIQEVLKKVVPAITDAWVAENVPEAKDTAGLRALVREEGMLYKAQEIEQMKYIGAASELAKRFTATIPDEFYEYTRNELMASLTEQLQLAGKTLEDFYSQQGFGEQEFSMQLMLQTRETLRQGFALDALARHLKMTVTQDDIEEALERISPNNKEEARQHFDATGRGWQLKEAALRTKANKWLYETATYKSID